MKPSLFFINKAMVMALVQKSWLSPMRSSETRITHVLSKRCKKYGFKGLLMADLPEEEFEPLEPPKPPEPEEAMYGSNNGRK